jgi:hypothetical protein
MYEAAVQQSLSKIYSIPKLRGGCQKMSGSCMGLWGSHDIFVYAQLLQLQTANTDPALQHRQVEAAVITRLRVEG